MDINIVIRAIEFAENVHRNKKVPGTEVPFVAHPFAVGLQLAKNFSISEDVIAAGFLHHTLEDGGVSLDDIHASFGENVARLVKDCTDDVTLPCHNRKVKLCNMMSHADRELKLLVCADNIQNLLDIKSEYRRIGNSVWDRLHGGKPWQAWYYRGLATSLTSGISHCMFHDLRWEVTKFFGWAGEMELEERMALEDKRPFSISVQEEAEMLREVSDPKNLDKRWQPIGTMRSLESNDPSELPILVAQGCNYVKEGKLSFALNCLGKASDLANGCDRLALITGNLARRTGRLLDSGKYFGRVKFQNKLYVEASIRKGRTFTEIVNRWRRFGLAAHPVAGWHGEGGKIYLYELVWSPQEEMIAHLPSSVKESLSRMGADRHLYIEMSIDTIFGEGFDDWPVYGVSPVMQMYNYMNSQDKAKSVISGYFGRAVAVNSTYKNLVNEALEEAGSDLRVEGSEMHVKDNWWYEFTSLERGDIKDDKEPEIVADVDDVKRRVLEMLEKQQKQRENMRSDQELLDLYDL